MYAYLRLLRPAEWIKNTFVFAALIFGGMVKDVHAVRLSLLAFAAFCLVSSAGYILNDMVDANRDRLHPTKKNRPIASGAISRGTATVLIVILIAGAVVLCSACLEPGFCVVLSTYFVLTVSYTLFLKYRMILDVIVIAVLFVLRAIGGAYAIEVAVSPWMLACTFMLCLFLGFGKRRCEIAMIGNTHAIRGHRPTLVRYTPELLTHLLSTSGGLAIITFLLYTLDTSWSSPFGEDKQNLIYTLPIVVYGIYRYAMLIELGKATGPTDLLIQDPAFLVAVVLWVISSWYILYHGLPVLGLDVGAGGSLPIIEQ
ncbi:MAG: decaprenyl-phosphate phosphoribosyltransferase [Planctomycetota bacterium]|jgi:4-hydroxybenzoate polyprenyltransferase